MVRFPLRSDRPRVRLRACALARAASLVLVAGTFFASAIEVRAQNPVAPSPTRTIDRLLDPRAKTFIKASSDPDERPIVWARGNDDGFTGMNQVEAFREFQGLDEVAVLADVRGRPGYMGLFFRNFWTGNIAAAPYPIENNRTQIRIDGQTAFDMPLADYFRSLFDPAGQVPPFEGPFTQWRAGAHLTHTPLAWNDSFRVQVFENSFLNASRFHKVAGVLGVPGESLDVPDIQAWDDAYFRISDWRHLGRRKAQTWAITIPAGGAQSVTLPGPATILEFRVLFDDPTQTDDLHAEFTWDNLPNLSVDCPVRSLGGLLPKPYAFSFDQIFVGNDGVDELWSYFPMHFEQKADLRFRNTSALPLKFDLTIAREEKPRSDRWGYFTTGYQTGVTQTGVAFDGPTLTNCRGELRGLFLEGVLDDSGRIPGSISSGYLEGDLCVRINGDRGDDHNFAATETSVGKWGWYNSASDVPFALDTSFHTGELARMRPDGVLESVRLMGSTFVFDPVHFVDGIDIRMEHGVQNGNNADYRLLSIFYIQPGAAREHVATLDLGDVQSEAAFGLQAMSAPQFTATSGFFRDAIYGTAPVTDEVREVFGSIQFDVAAPQLGTYKGIGLCLRVDRPRLGLGGLSQAEVFVDGSYAGLVHSWNSNGVVRWKEGGELEVELPRALTDGKNSFQVELRAVPGTTPLRVGQIGIVGYTVD